MQENSFKTEPDLSGFEFELTKTYRVVDILQGVKVAFQLIEPLDLHQQAADLLNVAQLAVDLDLLDALVKHLWLGAGRSQKHGELSLPLECPLGAKRVANFFAEPIELAQQERATLD